MLKEGGEHRHDEKLFIIPIDTLVAYCFWGISAGHIIAHL